MNGNNIIDAELTNNDILSNKGLNFLRISGVFSMILGIVAVIQILFGFSRVISELVSFSSFMDMGSYKYYLFSGMLNRFITIILNVFAVIYLFRYSTLATKLNKATFGKMEWTMIFNSLRNILIIYGIMNISWLLFSLLNLLIGMLID